MINIEELNRLPYEEASDLLRAAGYVQHDNADDVYNGNKADRISDSYYFLYDEDDNKIDAIDFVFIYNVLGTGDDTDFEEVESYWKRMETEC